LQIRPRRPCRAHPAAGPSCHRYPVARLWSIPSRASSVLGSRTSTMQW